MGGGCFFCKIVEDQGVFFVKKMEIGGVFFVKKSGKWGVFFCKIKVDLSSTQDALFTVSLFFKFYIYFAYLGGAYAAYGPTFFPHKLAFSTAVLVLIVFLLPILLGFATSTIWMPTEWHQPCVRTPLNEITQLVSSNSVPHISAAYLVRVYDVCIFF